MTDRINQLQVTSFRVDDIDAFLETAIMNIIIDTVRYYEGVVGLSNDCMKFYLPHLPKRKRYIISLSDVFQVVEVIGRHISLGGTCTVIASLTAYDQVLVNHCFVIRQNGIAHSTEAYGMYGFELKGRNLQKKLKLLADT